MSESLALEVREVRKDVQQIERHLYGNGKEGVLIRLDRLEQSRLAMKDRVAIWIGPIVSGVLVVIFQTVVSYLK
jgi:hypothetical protein